MKLCESDKQRVKAAVQQVLCGERDEWDGSEEHFPMYPLVQAVSEIDGVEEGEFESNGWQWDWWQEFIFDGRTFRLYGSGAYGGHGFSEKEEY